MNVTFFPINVTFTPLNPLCRNGFTYIIYIPYYVNSFSGPETTDNKDLFNPPEITDFIKTASPEVAAGSLRFARTGKMFIVDER